MINIFFKSLSDQMTSQTSKVVKPRPLYVGFTFGRRVLIAIATVLEIETVCLGCVWRHLFSVSRRRKRVNIFIKTFSLAVIKRKKS